MQGRTYGVIRIDLFVIRIHVKAVLFRLWKGTAQWLKAVRRSDLVLADRIFNKHVYLCVYIMCCCEQMDGQQLLVPLELR